MGMIELRAPIALKNALRVLMGKAQKISKKSNPAAASHQRLDTPEHLPAQASMISGGVLRLVTSSSYRTFHSNVRRRFKCVTRKSESTGSVST